MRDQLEPIRPGRLPPAPGAADQAEQDWKQPDAGDVGGARRPTPPRVLEGGVLGSRWTGRSVSATSSAGRRTWPAGRRPGTRCARHPRAGVERPAPSYTGLSIRRAGRVGVVDAAGGFPAGRSTRGCSRRSARWSRGCRTTACSALGRRPGGLRHLSFWRSSCLALAGERDRAHELFRDLAASGQRPRPVRRADRPGDRGAAGNFPQAFSHIGLINAAGVLTDVEQDPTLRECGMPPAHFTPPRR